MNGSTHIPDVGAGGSTVLGRGRSAIVYRSPGAGESDSPVAQKVFIGDRAADIVHCILGGAPNPYRWCADAIRCAAARRRILAVLVRYWFGEQLRVADAIDTAWNESHRAFELRAACVNGRHAMLHHPFSDRSEREYRELIRDITVPLQQHLNESGFDGLLWQAGYGNPVGASNFLYVPERAQWVWIDLESGIPAVAPLNVLKLFTFYLPRSVRHGRFLFDDVHLATLRRYLAAHRMAITADCGESAFDELMTHVDDLGKHQDQWKSIRRFRRSITFHHRCKDLSDRQAEWYWNRPARWYARLGTKGIAKGGRALAKLAVTGVRWMARLNYRKLFITAGLYVVSQRFRARLARRYVAHRIRDWQDRRQLCAAEAAHLRRRLFCEESSSYLTDFGVHLAVKPFVKTIQFVVVPGLLAAGIVTASHAALGIAFGGAAVRTLYTLGRLIQSALQGREKPWIALLAGVAPVVGNAAYPLQLLYSGRAGGARDEEAEPNASGTIAQFILYDTASLTGRLLPIWGGADTRTEHFFNRWPDLFVRTRPPLPRPDAGREQTASQPQRPPLHRPTRPVVEV